MKEFLYFLVFLILFSGCVYAEKRYPIWLKNESNADVMVQVSYNYPDSAILESDDYLNLVKSGERELIEEFDDPINDAFSEYYPKDTMLLFFFNVDTVEAYTWEEIRAGNKFLQIKSYSKEELSASKWIIEYQ